MLLVLASAQAIDLRVYPAGSNPVLASTWQRRGARVVEASPADVLWRSSADDASDSLATGTRLPDRLPSMTHLSDKRAFAVLSRSLGWGDFTPLTLASGMPREREEPFAWVVKGSAHRNVSVPQALPRGEAFDRLAGSAVIQRRIAAPLLIDGWAFDLGVYVVVTKVPSGLRYAVFDDILLRFCADRFTPTHAALQRFAAEGGAVLPTLQRGWVVSDDYGDGQPGQFVVPPPLAA